MSCKIQLDQPNIKLPEFLKLVEHLNDAIETKNYVKIEKMLADPQVPLNYKLLNVKLPVECMFSSHDPRIVQLFLQCPRVDWLAPAWDRNCVNLEKEYGVQYETSFPPKNQAFAICALESDTVNLMRLMKRSNRKVSTVLNYFYYLGPKFVKAFPQESEAIYERIFEELLKAAAEAGVNGNLLLFQVCDDLFAFKLALKRCADINVRDAKGRTILHKTCNPEVAQLVIDLGADVNTVDNAGKTPLKTASRAELSNLLLRNGAVASRNLLSSDLNKTDHEISEQVFRAALAGKGRKRSFDSQELDQLFQENPSFQEIFESDLPLHLLSVHNFLSHYYFSQLTDNEYLELVKGFICKEKWENPFEEITILDSRPLVIKRNANELLHCACKHDHVPFMKLLLTKFKADANSVIDGKRPLFLCHSNAAFKLLIKRNANPELCCDGFMFFEREDPLTNADLACLWYIRSKGFDLFKKASRSGKSFIESFHPQAMLHGNVGRQFFAMPLHKAIPDFLAESTYFDGKGRMELVPIDVDGNCAYHYSVLHLDEPSLQELNLDALKQHKNRFGNTPLDVLIEMDADFSRGHLIKDKQLFGAYVKEFEAVHGREFLYRNGGNILMNSFSFSRVLNMSLAEYLFDVVGVSVNRFMSDGLLADDIYDTCPDVDGRLFEFLKKRGFQRREPKQEYNRYS